MNRRFGDSSRRTFILDDQIIHVTSSPDPGVFQISIGDYTTTLSPTALSPTEMIAQFPHTRTTATIIPFNHKLHLFANGKHYTLSLPLPEEAEGTKVGAGDRLSSPMPATVIEVRVKVGDVVKEGQVCAVLESMKMEISIRAGRDGVVGEVGVEKGQVVEEGNMLVALKPEAEAQPDA
jgi:3-methylcrotonyl-CoA carboxylase alpha subunit